MVTAPLLPLEEGGVENLLFPFCSVPPLTPGWVPKTSTKEQFPFPPGPYQYKALPFGLSLSPRVFTKVVEAALVPLREAGIRILNYLDDWLILAQSRALLCEHRDMVFSHLSRLGLQVNREKSKLSPMQRISFLGMELDSVNLTARLSEERAQSMLRCLDVTSRRHSCCTTAVRPGHTVSAPQRKTDVRLHALSFYTRHRGAECAWRNTHANCHWLVLLTLIRGPGWNDPMTAVVPRVKGFAYYSLSFSRHNKNIKMEHFFLYILSRYFI